MDKEIQAAIIGAVAGIAGAILGGLIGAIAAWRGASSTNRVQQQIANVNHKLQQKLAEENAALQKKITDDNATAQRRAFIEAMILKLSEFAITYPTVEKEEFCSAYPKCPGDSNAKERYENYCTYVFNTIGVVWDFCDKDAAKVKNMLHVEELIRQHWRCWDGDKGNLGYDDQFREYIHSVITDLRRRTEIK